MELVLYSKLYLIFMLLNDPGYLLEEFNWHFKEKTRSAVGNVSGYRCVSDCRSRGRGFDPGPVPYFRGH